MVFTTRADQDIRVTVTTNGRFKIATVIEALPDNGINAIATTIVDGPFSQTIHPAPGRPNRWRMGCLERTASGGLKTTQIRVVLDPDSPNFPPGGDPNHYKEAFRTQNPGSDFTDAVLDAVRSQAAANTPLRDVLNEQYSANNREAAKA